MRKILAASLIFSFSSAYALDAEIIVDKYYSPYTGSSILISALRGYETLDDIFISGTVGDTSTCMSLARIGKWAFEYTLSSWAMVTQHEYFGHGYRGRTFKAEHINYRIKPFSGTTGIYTTQPLVSQQRAALAAAGMEATSVLAAELQKSFISQGEIDRREATFYLVNSLDQAVYAFSKDHSDFRADNDIVNYINQVNGWQGSNVLKVGTLKQKITWDFFDPMLYYSVYSIFSYLWHGDTGISTDTLHVGNARFMPSTRTILTPWGPELQLKGHFFTPENKYIGVFVRSGRTGSINSHGVDVQINPMGVYGNFSWGHRTWVWKQPHLLQNATAEGNHDKFGMALMLDGDFKVNSSIAAAAGIGFKTSGYVPGMQLKDTALWYVGLKFNLS